eukprot:TRINITY_DN1892_c0_g3_i1.p1 TRINITY_DN1892_c0_g3~~TRINITY_DN1892_c0_g3_i1.p1  ORF type:complete len:461 (+),score=81.00 TRINITY_DN1892_c0_g3_i1:33-1385(+)
MSALFPPLVVCGNASVLADSLCNNHGTCANKTDAECVCDGQYVKDKYCLTTISEELNNANYPLYFIVGLSFTILALLVMYDFIIDIKLKVWPSLKRPIAMGKISLWISCIALLIQLVLYHIDHSNNTKLYKETVEFFRFISDFGTIVTYSISALSWISVILTAKSLGKGQKSLNHFRRYVLVANLVLVPIYFVTGIIGVFINDSAFLLPFLGVVLCMFIFYLSLIVGTSVFIKKAFTWIRALDDGTKSSTTRRVKLKTYFIVGANVVGILRYMLWIYSLAVADTATEQHLYILIIQASQVILFTFFLFIMENHIIRLPLYVRTGEIRSNTFLPGSTRPSMTTSSKPSSRPHKKTESSTFEMSATTKDSSYVSVEGKKVSDSPSTPAENSLVTSSDDHSSSSGSGSGSYYSSTAGSASGSLASSGAARDVESSESPISSESSTSESSSATG